MLDRECIYRMMKEYLPGAEEDVLANLTAQAEKLIELHGMDIIRKLVMQRAGLEPAMFASRIDTKV